MSGYYETQQVCENGHQITSGLENSPETSQSHCDKCGGKTISRCPHCNTNIRSYHNVPGVVSLCSVKIPSYCHNCGKPYPWTENKILTAIQMFAEFGNLDKNEKQTIEADINNIAKDTPQSELSAMRIKKIWGKYGKIAYNVIMEFASKTAAEALKG